MKLLQLVKQMLQLLLSDLFIVIIQNFVSCLQVVCRELFKVFYYSKNILGLVENLEGFIAISQFLAGATLFFNLCFAHILAITLLAMANINSQNNWMHKKGIQDSPWIQQYVWSYYWGATIMLTVSFGDLSAVVYQQAIVLIFILMISIVTLVYNISCISTLIANIRSQGLQKAKNLKVFIKLAGNNIISQSLECKINNYMEGSQNIRKKFSYEEQKKQFIMKLPKDLKLELLKQSNQHIFSRLPFFKSLQEKTILNLAQKIQIRICYPQQIVQKIEDSFNLLILACGKVGFSVKKQNCTFNKKVIDQVQVKETEQPYLIDLNFIRKNRKTFQTISMGYSILYQLDHDSLIQTLKESEVDYQQYCRLRDKHGHIIDEFELFNCEICRQRHTKFTCPKIHFVPLTQHVIFKYLHKIKKDPRSRLSVQREELRWNSRIRTLKKYSILKSIFEGKKKRQKILIRSKQDKQDKQINDMDKQQAFNIEKQFQQRRRFISQSTTQIVKLQVAKLLQNKEFHDQVWGCQTDQIKDYAYYFQNDNPSKLSKKFSIQIVSDKENIVDYAEINRNFFS